MTRERMSRPLSSSPNGYSMVGASKRLLTLWSRGSCGASSGAATAMNTMITIMAKPTTAVRFPVRRVWPVLGLLCSQPHQPSAKPHTRVDIGVDDVHDKIDDHDDQGVDDHDRLQGGVVLLFRGANHELAQSRPR